MSGPVHRYMKSTPGCWAAYGEVLAREYSNPNLMDIHRLTVDTYAVQHPGATDRQSIQSVGFHLIRLCLFMEHNLKAERANGVMLEATKIKTSFVFLPPPDSLGPITVADIVKATSVNEHKSMVLAWARSTWEAWSEHHMQIRQWLPNKALQATIYSVA